MPGAVERLHHPLELAHLLAARAGRRVGRVRREEADRGVAPVVREPALVQEVLVGDVVDRQQLDRRHAERRQVLDRRVGGEPGVRAAQVLGDAGVALREALHVQLVDDRCRATASRRRSSPSQSNDGSTTTHFGIGVGVVLVVALEVGVRGARRDVRQRARRSGSTCPSIAFAYGSIRSLAGLKRWPRSGAQGPCTR